MGLSPHRMLAKVAAGCQSMLSLHKERCSGGLPRVPVCASRRQYREYTGDTGTIGYSIDTDVAGPSLAKRYHRHNTGNRLYVTTSTRGITTAI